MGGEIVFSYSINQCLLGETFHGFGVAVAHEEKNAEGGSDEEEDGARNICNTLP
jgi:hypothetical protein